MLEIRKDLVVVRGWIPQFISDADAIARQVNASQA
jgi:hypothetical protein